MIAVHAAVYTRLQESLCECFGTFGPEIYVLAVLAAVVLAIVSRPGPDDRPPPDTGAAVRPTADRAAASRMGHSSVAGPDPAVRGGCDYVRRCDDDRGTNEQRHP